MPDRNELQVGDRIRILSVPLFDREQREREIQERRLDAGWTANTIERIIAESPEVAIHEIDQFGAAGFEVELQNESGELEHHFLNILDDDSWEYC